MSCNLEGVEFCRCHIFLNRQAQDVDHLGDRIAAGNLRAENDAGTLGKDQFNGGLLRTRQTTGVTIHGEEIADHDTEAFLVGSGFGKAGSRKGFAEQLR